MKYVIDQKTGEYLWQCPKCHSYIRFSNLDAIQLTERAGGCQGCRARKTMMKDPGLIGLFLDFWSRTNTWPQSLSWMASVPNSFYYKNYFSNHSINHDQSKQKLMYTKND